VFPCWQWARGGKVFELGKFVMGTEVLPLHVPKLGNVLANVVGKVGGGEKGYGIDVGEL